MRSLLRRTAVLTLGIAALSLTALATPAGADPSSTPLSTDIVGAGSSTFEVLGNDLASGYNNANPRPATWLASWDAAGSATITPKTGAATINRPNSSDAGISALQSTTRATLDYARSSRGRQASDTGVVFVATAEDTVQYAVNNGSTGTNVPKNLTGDQLAAVYQCQVANWNVLPGGGNGTPIAELPSSASETRAFFLQSIGLTEAQVGTCVHNAPEHAWNWVWNNANTIAPFSKASYTSYVPLGSNGQKVISLNTSGYTANRIIYTVTRNDDGKVPDYLVPFMSAICSSSASAAMTSDGFTPLPSADFPNVACGQVS